MFQSVHAHAYTSQAYHALASWPNLICIMRNFETISHSHSLSSTDYGHWPHSGLQGEGSSLEYILVTTPKQLLVC